MNQGRLLAALAVLSVVGFASSAQADKAEEVAHGQKLFNTCKLCHSAEPGKNMIGPTLAGVVGRKAGTVAGFNYSDAMKNSGITWDEANLDAYLKDPKSKVPGNKMPFAGVKSDQDRHDLIEYLETLK